MQHKQVAIDRTTMAIEPLFNNNAPIYLSLYQVYMMIGTYVFFDSGDGLAVSCILQIMGDQVIVNQFVMKKELANPNLIVAGPITDESVQYMTELFQTSKHETIVSSDVTDISFVFKDTSCATKQNASEKLHR
eukprot:scaffold49697_cov62-Attheya_sp.AAC.2